MKVFTFICVHAWETNTHARVNLYEMSTYKSCWSWSVSQFSTCMSLLRHGFRNSKTDSQMYTFPDQMNWQFVQILMDSKFHSKLRVLDTDYVKQNSWAKDFFVFCSGKICLVLFQGCCSLVLRHLCPVHNSPIITILATHLLHEFIVNVKHRMDWSYRKPYVYICLSFNSCWCNMFNFGEYAEICHLPLTPLKESNFPWLILKFPDLINCLLRVTELNYLAL